MKAKATTFRIELAVQAGLLRLGKILHRPLNQLVNEAVRDYVARRSMELETDLEATLEELRAYRRLDPNFDRAIAAFIDAEATAEEDPAEGRVAAQPGPAQAKVLSMIDG